MALDWIEVPHTLTVIHLQAHNAVVSSPSVILHAGFVYSAQTDRFVRLNFVKLSGKWEYRYKLKIHGEDLVVNCRKIGRSSLDR